MKYHSFDSVPETKFSFNSNHNYPITQIGKKIIRSKLSENLKVKPDNQELDNIMSLTNDLNIGKIISHRHQLEQTVMDYYKKAKEVENQNNFLQNNLKNDLKIANYLNDIAQNKKSPQEFLESAVSLLEKQSLEKKATSFLQNVISSSDFNGANFNKTNIKELEQFIKRLNQTDTYKAEDSSNNNTSMSQETFDKLVKIFKVAEKVLKDNKNPSLIYFANFS